MINRLANAWINLANAWADMRAKPDPYIDLPNGSLVTAAVQLFSCGSCGFSFDAAHWDEPVIVEDDHSWTCPLCFPDIVPPLSLAANSDA